MTFTVLSDPDINALLESLAVDELEELRKALAAALHQYSGGSQDVDGDVFQEPRQGQTVHPSTDVTTRFSSSCGPGGMASKVVSLNLANSRSDSDTQETPNGALTLFSPTGSPVALLATPTFTSFRTALSSSCLLFKRASIKTLTVFGAGSQAYWHIRLALMLRGPTIRHVNIINHRFSSSAASILKRFTLIPQRVKDREGWGSAKFSVLTPGFVEFGRLVKEYMRDADVIYCCTPGVKEEDGEGLFDASILTSHEGRKKGRLICAVGGVEGERRELPDELVRLVTKQHVGNHRHFHKHADEGGVIVVDTLEGAMKHATELVAAKVEPTQMVEIGELVMLHRLKLEEEAAEAAEAEYSTATTTDSQLSSDVDSLSLSSHNRTPSMSAVYSSNRSSSRSPRSSTTDLPRSPTSPASTSPSRKGSFPKPFRRSSGSAEDKKNNDGQLARWMRDGTVVYRSVGLGVMDLVVGMEIVKLARDKGIGTQITDL